ncbi:MAG: FGGY-family carbohydrate kinase [Clostridia bacterium]|nr:FGGY-family carbohydrate kinase [Clostridia bacterium]
MNRADNISCIEQGRAVLGVELGSTRIKAVLINDAHEPIAAGNYEWENQLVNGLWTYSLDDVWNGLRDAYSKLRKDVMDQFGVKLTRLGAIGISAMMHGYLPFDKEDRLLVPFRTWRNTNAAAAAAVLTKLFEHNIPVRWSISHLYQAILNGEEHVPQISFFTTLAGYVHWQLTGEKVLGVGDAVGMFPIDADSNDYVGRMVDQFDELVREKGYPWKLYDILPRVLTAGEPAGKLTEKGARLLDESGDLESGIPFCPAEGDIGTGMVATNSVAAGTGNISAGTSAFAMIVLEKPLSKLHTEIDIVTTPSGKPAACVHGNNCTSDLNAWVHLFGEYAAMLGVEQTKDELYGRLFRKALEAEPGCGDLLSYNFYAGETIVDVDPGCPLFVRRPDSHFNLANFMRSNLYGALAVMKIGMDILLVDEGIRIRRMFGHGGLFKTKEVGQRIMAAAINAPVSVMETAGEGGAWGIALLAAYEAYKAPGEALEDYLEARVFSGMPSIEIQPDPRDVKDFEQYIERFRVGLETERAAVKAFG